MLSSNEALKELKNDNSRDQKDKTVFSISDSQEWVFVLATVSDITQTNIETL